jgi:hypothetical protein
METKVLSKQSDRLLITAILALITIIVIGITLVSFREPDKPIADQTIDRSQEQLIMRGAYLVNTSACHDCHSRLPYQRKHFYNFRPYLTV